MDFSVVISIISSCCISILLIYLMIFIMRDGSYNQQEEVKEIRHIEHDAEYNKLIEQYGRVAVYNAELDFISDIESSLSFADMCELQNEKLKERAKKLKDQEAEIKRIKSLSKEELELYLLQEKAIKQIKSK